MDRQRKTSSIPGQASSILIGAIAPLKPTSSFSALMNTKTMKLQKGGETERPSGPKKYRAEVWQSTVANWGKVPVLLRTMGRDYFHVKR
jgi:hypothetical protein